MAIDMNTFLGNIKRAAVEAVEAKKPMTVIFGKVTSAAPLKVQVDQKLELSGAQLVTTSAVRGHNALTAGEKVIILRADGGQKFIVLDRTEVQ